MTQRLSSSCVGKQMWRISLLKHHHLRNLKPVWPHIWLRQLTAEAWMFPSVWLLLFLNFILCWSFWLLQAKRFQYTCVQKLKTFLELLQSWILLFGSFQLWQMCFLLFLNQERLRFASHNQVNSTLASLLSSDKKKKIIIQKFMRKKNLEREVWILCCLSFVQQGSLAWHETSCQIFSEKMFGSTLALIMI